MALPSYQDHIENLTHFRSALLNGSLHFHSVCSPIQVQINRRRRCAILFQIERQLALHERAKAKVLQLLARARRPSPLVSHLFDI